MPPATFSACRPAYHQEESVKVFHLTIVLSTDGFAFGGRRAVNSTVEVIDALDKADLNKYRQAHRDHSLPALAGQTNAVIQGQGWPRGDYWLAFSADPAAGVAVSGVETLSPAAGAGSGRVTWAASRAFRASSIR